MARAEVCGNKGHGRQIRNAPTGSEKSRYT
jgi:hypothetical protein